MGKCLHCGTNVDFLLEDQEEICPECGWSKKASIQLPPSQQNGRALNIKPRKGWARATGIFLIIFGIVGIGNPVAFMLDLWAVISILKMKEKGRQRATGIQMIQLVIAGIGLTILMIFAFRYPKILQTYGYYLVITPMALIIHGIILLILTRPSVRIVFSQEIQS